MTEPSKTKCVPEKRVREEKRQSISDKTKINEIPSLDYVNVQKKIYLVHAAGAFVYRGKLCQISRYHDKSKT